MQIEEYFDFLGPDDIRIRGHRIGIESILDEYVHRHRTPEQIQRRFPTLSLEQVYATILYYYICRIARRLASTWRIGWSTGGARARNRREIRTERRSNYANF